VRGWLGSRAEAPVATSTLTCTRHSMASGATHARTHARTQTQVLRHLANGTHTGALSHTHIHSTPLPAAAALSFCRSLSYTYTHMPIGAGARDQVFAKGATAMTLAATNSRVIRKRKAPRRELGKLLRRGGRGGGGDYSESYTRKAQILTRWNQRAVAQRRL
jgi:hypothetical protein